MSKLEQEPRQSLQFVCDMLQQLLKIVPAQAGPLLPHLIDMARLEASELIVQLPSPSNDTRPPG